MVVIAIAIPLLTADPLKPGDTRTPEWVGVIASAERRELVDGRSFGQPAEIIEGEFADGNLILAGGLMEAPSWAMSLAPRESGCYATRNMGVDDGLTIVMRIYSPSASIGVRVTKAPGFVADPVFDGRYVGMGPWPRDVRLAVARRSVAPAIDSAWTPASIGYFCLNANGQVTKWDAGY